MKNFLIGGVPEHFNLPWYITLKEKKYRTDNINLRWKDYHGGTGQMCTALREGEIDMAVILTEGIIRDIIEGNKCKIVQIFIKTPLIWGIHVSKTSNFNTVEDIKGTYAAISRYGSGSHLMAYVNAIKNGWDVTRDLKFKEIKNLEGALKGLPAGNGDYFLWEKFTTKPYVDNGPFRIIGECPTPWPCFVLAVREDILENESESLKKILDILNNVTATFKSIPNIDIIISERYNQSLEDVQAWLKLTEWSQKNLSFNELEIIQKQLLALNLIENTVQVDTILHSF